MTLAGALQGAQAVSASLAAEPLSVWEEEEPDCAPTVYTSVPEAGEMPNHAPPTRRDHHLFAETDVSNTVTGGTVLGVRDITISDFQPVISEEREFPSMAAVFQTTRARPSLASVTRLLPNAGMTGVSSLFARLGDVTPHIASAAMRNALVSVQPRQPKDEWHRARWPFILAWVCLGAVGTALMWSRG